MMLQQTWRMAFALIEIIRRHQKGRSSNERSNKEMYGYNDKNINI
jgi:hypothetical protein